MRLAPIFLSLPLLGCVSAAPETVVAPPVPPLIAPDSLVAARQAGFQTTAAAFNAIKGSIDRGDSVKPQAFAARAVARWGRAIPSLFPAGTALPTSRAKAEIWTNRADFEAKAAALDSAATELAAIAQRDDKPAFAAQYKVVQQTCGACHSAYRAEAAR
jgi:cytochrome c556